ncbi:MAG: ATP synthase F1 subunit epsilon [Lachnospiraceae bacterium]|nr:ATP synthase F1 subunit epsilon [Lachnospiraceae bacterium]
MAEADNKFVVEIITPDRLFYKGDAAMIEFTTTEGEIGVYKNHVPTTVVLAPGIVTIHEGEGNKKAAVHAGFAEILNDKVTLLAEVAEWPDEIDVERAKAAEARATERIQAKADDLDLVRAELALKRALVRQNIVG